MCVLTFTAYQHPLSMYHVSGGGGGGGDGGVQHRQKQLEPYKVLCCNHGS